MSNQQHSAVALFGYGFEIFPLQSGRKIPAVRWVQDWDECHFTSRDEVADYWDQHPDANIGIECGRSALFVVDIDSLAAMERFANLWLSRQGTELRDYGTVIIRTRRGWQIWFAMPADPPLHNTTPEIRASRRGRDELGKEIDTRGAGGMVVGPGSVVCYDGDGNRVPPHTYRLISGDLNRPLPLPPWLEDLLRSYERREPTQLQTAVPERPWATWFAEQQLRARCASLAVALPGNRNSVLNRESWHLRLAVPTLGAEHVEAELLAAAERNNLPTDEARRTIRSGLGG